MKERVVILGAKESGIGAAILALKQGWDVFVSDGGAIAEPWRSQLEKLGVRWEEGSHTYSEMESADLVIKSPGIPEKAPLMKELRKAGKKIVSEIEFASWYTDSTIIAITGSNGKTTTTSLIHHMMVSSGLDAGLGGNIGNSFAKMVAEEPHPYYVIEVSSFQLDDIYKFRPDIAVLTNITEDHLDRYEYQLAKYADSKLRITMNQREEDHFVYCMDDPVTLETMKRTPVKAHQYGFCFDYTEGAVAWMNNTTITLHMNTDQFSLPYDQLPLKGRHNAYNTMAAAVVGRLLDIRKESVREAFMDFKNIEHRLEKVAMVRGVEYINDSKATNVNSAWYALESADRPVVWIVGGVDKGNDYSSLIPLVEKKVKAIVALGRDVMKIQQAFSRHVNMIVTTESMEEAVKLSYHFSDKGDCVLLSPACASFDLFENYEDRGRQFKKAVREL
jgi:UDP-N-acetylmuramoylalanine--D-glutamate ligase